MQVEAQANILAHCADQEPGTLCFGHPTVSAVWRPGAAAADSFRNPGDTISIDGIDWLSISTEAKTWGTARALSPRILAMVWKRNLPRSWRSAM